MAILKSITMKIEWNSHLKFKHIFERILIYSIWHNAHIYYVLVIKGLFLNKINNNTDLLENFYG